MASNAVAATLTQARNMAANAATAKVPVKIAHVAAQAGYPGSKASSVRGLFRATGHGAQANGQGQYNKLVPAAWVAAITCTQAGLSPQATAAQVKAATGKALHNQLVGKQAAATAQGKRAGKAQAKQAAAATAQAATGSNA